MIKLALLDDADGFARSVARLSFELATDLYSVVLENKANRPTLSQVLLPKIIAEFMSRPLDSHDPPPAERFIRELAETLAQDAMARACGMREPAKWESDWREERH